MYIFNLDKSSKPVEWCDENGTLPLRCFSPKYNFRLIMRKSSDNYQLRDII